MIDHAGWGHPAFNGRSWLADFRCRMEARSAGWGYPAFRRGSHLRDDGFRKWEPRVRTQPPDVDCYDPGG
jgi:hypothetical protein